MITTSAIGLGAIGATIVAGWNTIKEYLFKFSGLFFHRFSFDEASFVHLMRYLQKNNWKPVSNNFKHIFCEWKYSKSYKESIVVFWESYLSFSEKTILRKKIAFISITPQKFSIIAPKFVNLYDILKLANLQTIDAHLNAKQYPVIILLEGNREKQYSNQPGNVNESSRNIKNDNQSSFPAYIIENVRTALPIGVNISDLELEPSTRLIKNLWLDESIKHIVNESETWLKKKQWYLDRNIPWKRGFLFYGQPGTGKTKVAAAISQNLCLPLYIFDLASMNNHDFTKHYRMQSNSNGRIVLLEDIDTIFDGRKNLTATQNSPGLTFDCLLNEIDGVETSNGTFLIITTNNISKLDEALLRPGRIDRKVEFKGLNLDGRKWMAEKIFKGFDKKLWEHLIDQENDISGACFQNICCEKALDLFWENKNDN